MPQGSTKLSERSVGDVYLETDEAARYLKFSPSHFRVLVRVGKLPQPVRPGGPGGKLLWRQSALDAHMRALEAAHPATAVTEFAP